MDFIIAAHTDAGIKKATNQDSILVEKVDTDYGKVCFAVVCDGMGGLEKGELASATCIRAFQKWFHEEFPSLLYKGIAPEALKNIWVNLILETNLKIVNYGIDTKVRLGTTVAVLLIVSDVYYIIHVGDTRVYKVTNQLTQMTKDQTVVQREVDAGRMTPEQAEVDSQKSVLLQCIGASSEIEPDFQFGSAQGNTCFLLCSDGFRHVITPEEILGQTNPQVSVSEAAMTERLTYLTDLVKYRREKDNISSVLVRTI